MTGFNKNNVLVKFVATSDNGNNLYIDNINLSQKNPTGISKTNVSAFGVNLYPNPAAGMTNLNITASKASEGKITVTNTLGQVVFAKTTTLTQGSNTVSIDVKEYAAGVYNVVIDSNEGSVTKKLTVTK
jgi:hypothetical protein